MNRNDNVPAAAEATSRDAHRAIPASHQEVHGFAAYLVGLAAVTAAIRPV